MIKYAKITNEETGLCEVGLGTNIDFYKALGMVELDVQQSDIDDEWYLTEKCPMKTDEEKELEEKIRIGKLSLTKREVFLALYRDKGITPEQVRSQITDVEAQIEFDYATEYYRFNPLIDQIGLMLGYTSEELDYLFENKVLPEKPQEEVEQEVTTDDSIKD